MEHFTFNQNHVDGTLRLRLAPPRLLHPSLPVHLASDAGWQAHPRSVTLQPSLVGLEGHALISSSTFHSLLSS